MEIKVLVDSCGDLPNKFMKEFNIGMIPLNIDLGEMLRDRVDITPQEYYSKIYEYNLPNTSSPNLSQWKDAFDEVFEQGYEHIVVTTLSSKLSNTYQQACVAAKKFYKQQITVIDTLNASAGEGLIGIRIKELLDIGISLDETIKHIEQLRSEVIQIGYMNSLKMLVKTGRISKASEFFANLGRMKPMIITENGENKPLSKVISLNTAKKKTVEELSGRVDDDYSYSLFITHANSKNDAEELKEMIISKIDISKSIIGYMGPVVGSRVGLGAILAAVIPDKKFQ